MTESKKHSPAAGSPKKDALAAALRENLRRRKAAVAGRDARDSAPTPQDETDARNKAPEDEAKWTK